MATDTPPRDDLHDLHDLDDRPGDPVVVETWLGAPALSYARRPHSLSAVLDRALQFGCGFSALISSGRWST